MLKRIEQYASIKNKIVFVFNRHTNISESIWDNSIKNTIS